MKKFWYALVAALIISALPMLAEDAKPAGVLSANDVKQVMPSTYFFRGQSAPVQLRNSGGIRTKDGTLVLAGLVDTSGYSSDIQQKYQGLLITEVPLNIEGSELKPGAYGFGFSADGKFTVMDVGAHDVLSVACKTDSELKRPVPLKVVEESGAYRLYAGRKYVSLKAQ